MIFSAIWKSAAKGLLSVAAGALIASSAVADDATQGVDADKVITLGTWVPRSGPLAGLGSSGIDGSYLVFDDVNEKGGINGYKIKVIEVDDGYELSGISTDGVRRQGFWDNRRRELTEALVHQVCHIRPLHLDEASGAV